MAKNKRKRLIAGVWVPAVTGQPRQTYSVEDKILIAEKICNLFSTGKYSIEECALRCGITSQVFFRWACPTKRLDDYVINGKPLPSGAIPTIQEMYFNARELHLGHVREGLLPSAYRKLKDKIEGEQFEEVTEEYEIDRELYITDHEGNQVINKNFGKLKLVGVKQKKGKRPADTELLKQVLFNFDPNNFKDKRVVEQTGTVRHDHTINLEKLSQEELAEKKKSILEKLKDKGVTVEDIDHEEV